MFRKRKEREVDIDNLNEILEIGKRLMQIIYIVTIIVLIVLGTYLLKEWKVFNIIKELLIVISPIFIGIIIAWLFDPLLSWLQSKKVPRLLGCILIYLVFIGGLSLVIYLLVPTFAIQVKDFIGAIPDIVVDAKIFINGFFENIKTELFDISAVKQELYHSIENFAVNITTDLPNSVLNMGKSVISGGISLVLGVMIGFYMLYDYNKINKRIMSIIPNKWLDWYKELMSRINNSLRGYVQGVFIVMFLVFITQGIGLTLAGLKAPLLFALFCAITDIIPYFGPYIGAIPAVLVGFSQSPVVGICTVVSIVVVQTLENNFYQPLIMGHTMKLHPVTIMISLLIFQHFFGIIGMVVATPVVACLKVIFLFLNEKFHFFEGLNNSNVKEALSKDEY